MGKKMSENLSIIDKELKIEGSISSKGKLIVKGRISGTIDGETVIIAEGGAVDSSGTTVASMTIGGSFQGEIKASRELIILSTGVCAGKVECKDLIVENGGVLNAEVACKTSSKIVGEKDTSLFGTRKLNQEKQIEL